ncbi:MAG: hypothetical protein ACRBBS_16940 [Thalassovita sp.]
MKQMLTAVQAETTPLVRAWLNFMTLVLVVGGAVFMFSHTAALLVFLSAIASLLVAIVLFGMFQNIYVLGATHIPLWRPLVAYILATEFSGGADFSQPYTVWLAVASLVMVASLIFDMRDLYLVLATGRGRKRASEV